MFVIYSGQLTFRGAAARGFYILPFKTDPLIKVGFSCRLGKRAGELALERSIGSPVRPESMFNLGGSYIVSANCNYFVSFLEMMVKSVFEKERMLRFIESMKLDFPETGYRLIKATEEDWRGRSDSWVGFNDLHEFKTKDICRAGNIAHEIYGKIYNREDPAGETP